MSFAFAAPCAPFRRRPRMLALFPSRSYHPALSSAPSLAIRTTTAVTPLASLPPTTSARLPISLFTTASSTVAALPALSETQMLFRMLVAVVCGATIGVERRAASATAGVRTLSLVSLGAAIFSLTVTRGLSGDPTRMAAAISTGVGFLGSAAIEPTSDSPSRHLVTAASIWVAAALGVAAAAGLFRLAFAAALVTVCIVRWRTIAACGVLVFRASRTRMRKISRAFASRMSSAPVVRNPRQCQDESTASDSTSR